MSASSPERLGDDAPAMRRAMREALEPFAAESAVEEIVEAEAEVFGAADNRRAPDPALTLRVYAHN